MLLDTSYTYNYWEKGDWNAPYFYSFKAFQPKGKLSKVLPENKRLLQDISFHRDEPLLWTSPYVIIMYGMLFKYSQLSWLLPINILSHEYMVGNTWKALFCSKGMSPNSFISILIPDILLSQHSFHI